MDKETDGAVENAENRRGKANGGLLERAEKGSEEQTGCNWICGQEDFIVHEVFVRDVAMLGARKQT